MADPEPEALRRRLRRLGRSRARTLASVALAHGGERRPAQALPPGQEIDTPFGRAYRIEVEYPLDHAHGPTSLADLLKLETSLTAQVAGQPELALAPPDRLLFLDTETTGLAGGAGTLLFLVGVGVYHGNAFRLRQYFLRDPSEERAMLHALQEDIQATQGFVSFNGRTFDLPLLEMRYTVSLRRRWPLGTWPHLDLLYPARRLWRRALPDCTLSTLELQVLGVRRTEQDVCGAEIPGLYLEYLRTGDTAGMARIIYHNAVDILSLVSLATQVLLRHREGEMGQLSAPEALGVARWHQAAGRNGHAEQAYRAALVSGQSPNLRLEAMRRYASHLKRQERHEDALECWQEWHSLAPEDPTPCIELAKYYEWRARDWAQARHWAQQALTCLSYWPPGWRRERAWAEVEHRLARLARKMGGGR